MVPGKGGERVGLLMFNCVYTNADRTHRQKALGILAEVVDCVALVIDALDLRDLRFCGGFVGCSLNHCYINTIKNDKIGGFHIESSRNPCIRNNYKLNRGRY